MTPDELEQLILETKNSESVRLAFKGMDEKARKKLSTAASKIHRQLHDGKANASASDRLQKFLKTRKDGSYTHWNSRTNSNAALAVFALGPLSSVRKWQTRPSYEDRQVFRKLIADRRPDWLADWIDHELEQEWTQLDFPTIRIWVRDGLISKPTSDGYFRLFASHLMRTGFYGRDKEYVPPISTQLLEDPDLLEDIEGLFRVETNAFNTNSWLIKGAPDHYETWPQALVKLAEGGHYDRGKLLDLALAGLQADIKQNQLSGYHKFFKLLEPSDNELVARLPALVALLCHTVGHVAKFAIDMLAALEKAKLLDDDQVLRELPTVFASDGKGNGIAALRLLEKVLKRSAKLTNGQADANALAVVIEGLRHPNADVQAKAIGLLNSYSKRLDRSQWHDIEGFSVFIAASNRAAMTELLGQAGDAVEPASVAAVQSDAEPVTTYQPDMRKFADWSVLDEADQIAPVTELQELIDLAFHCAEVVDDVDEIERLVDGISRLADQRPADFKDRVAPLIHRMNQRGASLNGLASAFPGVAEAMRALVLTWAMGELRGTHKQELAYYSREDAFVPMIAFLHLVARQVNEREPRQLLSAITHRGGWIDPLVWVERLQAMNGYGIADSMDFRLSLLRLAPDNRAGALEKAHSLPGSAGRLVRFALGGDEVPLRNDRKHYPSWISAARARDPFADWSEVFKPLGVDDPWPGGAVPATYRWSTSSKAERVGDMRWKTPIFEAGIEQQGGEHVSSALPRGGFFNITRYLGLKKSVAWEEMPTAAVNQDKAKPKYYWAGDLNTTWVAQWLAYIWPQSPAYAYFRAAKQLVQRVDGEASNWNPSHGFFKALFVRGRVWSEGEHLLLALGLVGKDADAKGLAIDAMIEGIETRQFDPARFAGIVARLAEGGWLKYNRLGESLKQVVQVSTLHASAIGTALQKWLPHFDLGQRNSFHVLEALLEAQAIAPQPLSDALRAGLESLKGKSKTSSLAKQLLASVQGP